MHDTLIPLHPVPGCIDEHEHVSATHVHPHAVVHYAAQTVEPHAHVHRFVVQPVAHSVVKAKHCRLRLVPLYVFLFLTSYSFTQRTL